MTNIVSRFEMVEEGDEELGFSWDIKVRRGDRLVHVASFVDEEMCKFFLNAGRWIDTLAEGKMSLSAEGIAIGKDGIPKAAPSKNLNIVFTPATSRTKRK